MSIALNSRFASVAIYLLGIAVILAENNTDLVITGPTTTNIGGTLTIGDTGTNNSLQIYNGGAVTNTLGVIGNATTASDNYVIVQDAGSLWQNNGDLRIGSSGSDNTLIITNGGRVNATGIGYFGYLAASSSNNSMIVTGTGSIWSNVAQVYIGNNGGGNSLTISDGGRVDFASYLQMGFTDNNTALVTGSNSVWNLGSSLEVGLTGKNNQMKVADGAKVYNPDGYIGYFYASGQSNSVVVTGPGSVWSNAGLLHVGYAGRDSSLIITNGGKVYNTTGTIGQDASGSNSTILVGGPGSLWNNSSTLLLGNNGGGNSLIITNGGRVNAAGSFTIVGYLSAGSGNNNVVVDGAGSVWSNSNYMIFGNNGTNNTMTVANGGRVDVLYYLQGYSDNNTLLVTGANSLMSMPTSAFEVGMGGKNNMATIADGARVDSFDGYLGNGTTGSNNVVLVTGNGATWTNRSVLHVGYTGGYNRFLIQDGGRVDSLSAIIGSAGALAGNNYVEVSGAGSLWKVRTNTTTGLVLGQLAGGNNMVISNGATVDAIRLLVGGSDSGFSLTAGNNHLVVSGTGTTVNTMYPSTYGTSIGFSSSSNSMTIANGARVDSDAGYIGYYGSFNGYNGDYNRVVVTDPGSVWSNRLYIEVGVYGAYGQLIITNGGYVYVGSQNFVGNIGPSNSALVTGPGSVWTNGQFYIGYQGQGNSLTVADGGAVYASLASIGGFGTAAGSNNSVIVTGTGSVFSVSEPSYGLIVGTKGINNSLIVSNGGLVTATRTMIGGNPSVPGAGASNNYVIVTGNGSVLTNNNVTYGITLGYQAGSNSFTISDGGKAYGPVGYVGYYTSDNTALVTGSNSEWTASSAFQLGVQAGANGNKLTIAQSGRVNTLDGYIGNNGSSNVVVVTDSGSLLNATSGLRIGYDNGVGNVLIITNGGQVIDVTGYVGQLAPSSNNHVEVTGNGSLWQNSGTVYVGSNALSKGSGTVLVRDGGTLESIGLVSGFNNSGMISNRQGIYQFTTATPTITPNTAGSVLVTNGTISYRGVTDANIYNGQVANITFQGNNTFRLNSSSNVTGLAAYNFDSVANTGTPTNYQRLALINDGSTWRSTTLNIGTGGELLVSNAANATVAATVNNLGSINVVDSKVTWSSNVTVSGGYISDPSTNTFVADVTVNQSGFMAGGVGDLFDFKKSFIIQSTNSQSFKLQSSAVQFSGGGMHTNEITGLDLGGSGPAYDAAFAYGTNFAYGELHLGSASDEICFFCNNSSPSNALYVGWLDLLTNVSLVANLHASNNITIYYAYDDSRNAYLGNQIYQLTQCDGITPGGFLAPVIPEPSILSLTWIVACLVVYRRAARS